MQAELQKPKYTKEQIVSWITRFKYGDVDDIEYQKQIIDTFINAIYVFDDKLVFTYNFKDGTEAIPLKAVEDAFGSDLTQVAPPICLKVITFRLFYCLFRTILRLESIKSAPVPSFFRRGGGYIYLFSRLKTDSHPHRTAYPSALRAPQSAHRRESLPARLRRPRYFRDGAYPESARCAGAPYPSRWPFSPRP